MHTETLDTLDIDESTRIHRTADYRAVDVRDIAPIGDDDYEFRAMVETCGYVRAMELSSKRGDNPPAEFRRAMRRAMTWLELDALESALVLAHNPQ